MESYPSYRDLVHWKQYLPFLPASLAMADQHQPGEEWWPWRDAEIHLDRHAVASSPCTVILLHGAGGYGRLLAPYGRMLAAAGYEVVAPDLPGYGLSRVPRAMVDHAAWVDCIASLIDAEHARSGRAVVLFGCSLGGFLAYLAAAKSRAASGIIATTLADPREPAVQAQFARNALFAKAGLPLLPLMDALAGGLRLPVRWFSRMHAIANDAGLVDVFLHDPCGAGNRVPLHFMRSLFDACPDIEPEQFDDCPVLLAHPADDRWTTVEASRLFFDRLKGEKQLVLLERCGHFPVEEPGVSQLRNAVLGFLEGVCRKRAA